MLVALEGEEAEGVGYAVGVGIAEGGDEGGGELGESGEVEADDTHIVQIQDVIFRYDKIRPALPITSCVITPQKSESSCRAKAIYAK